MRTAFVYTVKILVRDRAVLLWAVAFPLILSSMFYAVFSNLDQIYTLGRMPVLVVQDDNYAGAPQFATLIDQLGVDRSSDPLLEPTFVPTEAQARDTMADQDFLGFIQVTSTGKPTYVMDPGRVDGSADVMDPTRQSVILTLLDRYSQDAAYVADLAKTDPSKLADPALLAALSGHTDFTQPISATTNPVSDTVRYFYAALAFSCIMMMSFGLSAVSSWKADASPVGARRSLGGQSWTRSLAPTLAAAWLLSFICVLIGFCYIRFAFGISFGGKEWACVAVLALSTLVSTLVGALIGAINAPTGVKSGLTVLITCVLSAFAGLYGPPSQKLGDWVAVHLPGLSVINPVRQVYEAFYNLYYYDSYSRFTEKVIILAITAVVGFVVCVAVMRRTRYRSL
ncbi:MAG: ABC transporter permease [Propionibacteriaceae bacterium]|jgi:hypothetical protein|nr:ABC transporter permease [Propionibacteriaceae bacterium]